MREKFDIQRFLSILRISRGVLGIKAIAVIALTMALVFTLIDSSFPGSMHSANAIFFVFMLMRSNTFFSQMSNRGLLTYYLLLPATLLEKFAAFLTALFFDPIILYVIATRCERLLMSIVLSHSTTLEYMNPGVFWVYILFFSSLLLIRMRGGWFRNLQVMTILYIALFGGVFFVVLFFLKYIGLMTFLKENGIYFLMLTSMVIIGLSYRLFQKMEVKAFTITND